jgi:hypothetical protein
VRIGLRQGCPLSTTLFNLYIWYLHQHLISDVKGAGVRLQGVADDEQLLVTELEYADDVALCASSPKELQDLINSFVAYCARHGLTVNPRKCEVVVVTLKDGTNTMAPGHRSTICHLGHDSSSD